LAKRCVQAPGRANVRNVGGTDALLAARLAAGDDQALEEAFDRLAPAVYGAALYVLGQTSAAQDVVQDVFVELWSHPDRYDPAIGKLRTYLTVLARNRAVDVIRSELRRIARQERHFRLTPGVPDPSPQDEVATAEAASVVREAVRLLPDTQRHVIELAYFKGMTCREVALEVGIPEGTAKSRLRLAMAKLEAVLDRHLLESP
jgi:RNA polymerase sigma-70 factor (ECF subfamily)